VVTWLEDLGYLNDQRFSQSVAESAYRAGWGPVRVRQTLLRKGVPAETVAAVEEPDTDIMSLAALVHRRFGRVLADDPGGGRRKAAGFLARKGHRWDTIERVLRMVSGTETEDAAGAGET